MSLLNPRTWLKNRITVELLETRMTDQEEEHQIIMDDFNEKLRVYESINNTSITTHQRKSMWESVFRKSVAYKSELIRDADKVKTSFIHTGIVELLVQDSLAPSPTTNNVIDLTSKNAKINQALKSFQEDVDIDAIAKSIIDDVITYGEYYLSVETEEGKGITKVLDNKDQRAIVPVYEGAKPIKFLALESTTMQKKVAELSPDEIVHFCLGTRKLRIKIDGMDSKQGSNGKISEYVRIGIPFFYGVFDLINILTLLTQLVPASYLQKINSTSIIGISVSEGMDPQKAFNVCRRYENLLNKSTSYNPDSGEMTVQDLITAAGRYKAIPILGEKGRMEKMDPRYDEITDIAIFQELKKDIFGTVGVPYNFFYGGETSKGETLKMFARYTKKLSMIQTAMANGMKQMAKIHLKQLGLEAGDMIECKFANTLISVEELDKLEFESTLMGVVGEMVEVVTNVASQAQGEIDGKILGEFVDKRLSLLSLAGVIKFPPKPKPESEPEPEPEPEPKEEEPKEEPKPTAATTGPQGDQTTEK